MIKIQGLNKSYGPQDLFENASLQMSPGERLGLVGRNGFGKSTLFRLLLEEEDPDSGSITKPRNYRIGHLAQHLNFTMPTILEEGCLGLLPEEEWDHYRVEAILFGLGFTKKDMDRAPSEFSGGFQIRLNLAKVLVSRPNLLLLDEPTNYLDIVSIRWLAGYLRDWDGEMILISHDRGFMDSVTTHTALINRRQIRKVEGNTEKLYELVAQEDEIYEKTLANEDKQRKHAEAFINRFRAQAGRAAMVQSRLKMLNRMPERQQRTEDKDLDFDFHYAPFEAKTLMTVTGLTFGYDANRPLMRDLTLQIQAHDRVAIIGRNGKGKSTLLNVLAGELQAQSGEVKTHPNMKLGYFGQTNISRLNPKMTVEQSVEDANGSLTKSAVMGLCGLMMFSGEQAEKKVAHLSGGEKSRVLLARILAAPANLLFLDEPTNHLDMQSIEALMESMEAFEGASIIVTHSEEILRRIATKIVIFHHGKAELFPGTYDEFLERIGWDEEEGEEDPVPVVSAPIVNKKEERRQRSQQNVERSKLLGPLKEKITTLESSICANEEKLKNVNEGLVRASETKDTTAFASLSKEAKDLKKSIEEEFQLLESKSQELAEMESASSESELSEC